jgi:broad specificity phosphatase PhoE
LSRLVFLARHASPDWERRDLPYHLPPGPPLTKAGRQEAAVLGDFLQASGIRRLYSSPLERCLDTAAIAAQAAGQSVHVLDDLREWQPGETREEVQQRMLRALEITRQAANDEPPCVLITHGGPIAALLLALGMDENRLDSYRVYDHRNLLPPAGAWRVQQADGEPGWACELIFPSGMAETLPIDQG